MEDLPKRILTPRPGTEWISDPTLSFSEHVAMMKAVDFSTVEPSSIARLRTHKANLEQKSVRIESVRNNRRAVIAHRALMNAAHLEAQPDASS